MTTQADIKLVIDLLKNMIPYTEKNEATISVSISMLETLGNELDRVTKCAQHSQGLYERERDKYDQLSNQVAAQAAAIEKLRGTLKLLSYSDDKAVRDIAYKALAIPTDSTQILQEWLDPVIGEPHLTLSLGTQLFKKPEILK